MELIFVHDQLTDSGKGIPNLAIHSARPYTQEWRAFDRHWPWTVPLRLTMYLDQNNIAYSYRTPRHGKGWYPIAFGWFDFTIDYIGLIPTITRQLIAAGHIRILFYYHEGDNPQRINRRLTELCHQHGLSPDCYLFVSANTSAHCWFSEHACFFRYLNRQQPIDQRYTSELRYSEFTLLSRQHKWWRATVVADLHRDGLLDRSLWSYRTQDPAIDHPEDNPISVHTIPDLWNATQRFIDHGPYQCDTLDIMQHNDHHVVNTDLYVGSFFHIILETHFDADQSGGTFLTEKTWKCIKYGQPFVIVGPHGSLRHLRTLGFKTFDRVLDNSYDDIEDATERWLAVKRLIAEIRSGDIKSLWLACQADVIWNRNFFDTHSQQAVNMLLERLK